MTTKDLTQRIEDTVLPDALNAFWDVVAAKFPEITTGDLDPMASFRFEQAALRVVEDWILCNQEQSV